MRRVTQMLRDLLPAHLARPVACLAAAVVTMACVAAPVGAQAAEADVIFKKSTVWKFLTPDDKLVVHGIDDPVVNGVACHYTLPERGGVSGMFGVADEVSDISLACRQVGPISFKEKFEQGDVVFRQSRSMLFKKMQIVRGCDTRRNVLVYLVYSDRLVDGSPKNSTSTVPIMPWGGNGDVPRCADFLK